MLKKDSISDEGLLQMFNNCDEKALALIYEKYWEIMFVAANNIIKDKAICEDLIQDVFVVLWSKRDTIYIKKSIKSYLYTSTVYKVYSYLRKNKNFITEEFLLEYNNKSVRLNPEGELIYKELVAHLDAIVETLTPKCKIVYKLSREGQLSHKEIAEKLSISQRTVESHISNALKVIRASLGNTQLLMILFILIKRKFQ